MNARNTLNAWFCVDCTVAEVNGDYNPERPEDFPPVLSKVQADPTIESVTRGLFDEEHDCGHTCDDFCNLECGPRCQNTYCCCSKCCSDPVCLDAQNVERDEDEECGCERISYSTIECDGCGDWNHGERWAFTLWLREEPKTCAMSWFLHDDVYATKRVHGYSARHGYTVDYYACDECAQKAILHSGNDDRLVTENLYK